MTIQQCWLLVRFQSIGKGGEKKNKEKNARGIITVLNKPTYGSMRKHLDAAVRLMATPPALRLIRNTLTLGSVENVSMIALR